jgi:exopolyphosphatase/guanosine-5'-triphosphate,3'-diphosphate pyrophosphatase
MIRKASIDIGTNSTRLLVAELDTSQAITPLYMEEQITRLGQGLGETGVLSAAAIARVISAISAYQVLAKQFGAEEIIAFATSAARDAGNRSQFLGQIAEATGIAVRVLSGEKEAALSFLGAISDVSADEPLLICDIGGGSTELIIGDRGGVHRAVSVDVGSRRLYERYFVDERTVVQAVTAARDDVLHAIQRSIALQEFPPSSLSVGGTATTLAMIMAECPLTEVRRIHHYAMTLERLQALIRRLAGMSIAERKTLTGLHPDRADVILTGAVVLEAVLSYFKQAATVVSLRDLLFGVFLEGGW